MRDYDAEYDDELPEPTRRRSFDEGEADLPLQRPRLRRRARGEARDRESLKQLVRDIPSFLKLLGRLVRDPRVSRVDKGLLVVTIAYVVSPFDLIPDFIPVLGELDDAYLLALALARLLNNAGIDLLLEHWDGDVASLELAISALDRAGSVLPEPIRGLLRRRVR
ncbi:MAG TPA: YkvA family protein [Longimicrobiaceae bacterium]|nr:YkvA family protein [Longimicrobiaceae bacterium]